MNKPTGRYFSFHETICHGDGSECPTWLYENLQGSLNLADKVRAFWKSPLIAVSWYRSPEWNQHLIDVDNARGSHGVASGSEHLQARAVDLRPMNINDVQALYEMIINKYSAGDLSELGGIGIYLKSGWVHVDTSKAVDWHLRKWIGT